MRCNYPLPKHKAAEEGAKRKANSIPAGVKNNTAMKLTASRCCFIFQAVSYALTVNQAETCRSASTGSASPVQITTHPHDTDVPFPVTVM